MEYLTQNQVAVYALAISLVTLCLSFRAYKKSKDAERMAFQRNALEVLIEWRSQVRKVDWESFFIDREIEVLLEKHKNHKELLMWQVKILDIRCLPEGTLEEIEKLRLKAEASKNSNFFQRLIIDSNRGKVIAGDSLMEMKYIREALNNFHPESPKYYRGN